MKKIFVGVLITVLSVQVAFAQEYETIVGAAVATEDLSTLVTAVTAAELVETLSSEGPFTVFAPLNSAFDKLPEGTLESVLAEPKGALTDILTYHVVAGDIRSTDLTNGNVKTLLGKDITVDLRNGVKINGANVVIADLVVGNGVVHVIDTVLLPPAETSMMKSQYVVRAGDTLSLIAKEMYGDMHAYGKIFDANRNILSDPNWIHVGQTLVIPE